MRRQDAAELWEIDENFARAELTDAQRADHHVRREAILVRRGEVKTSTGPNKVTDKLSATQSYAAKAAADIGVAARTIRRDLSRGKNIAPDVLAEVTGTSLDKGVVLDELARVPAEVPEASRPPGLQIERPDQLYILGPGKHSPAQAGDVLTASGHGRLPSVPPNIGEPATFSPSTL